MSTLGGPQHVPVLLAAVLWAVCSAQDAEACSCAYVVVPRNSPSCPSGLSVDADGCVVRCPPKLTGPLEHALREVVRHGRTRGGSRIHAPSPRAQTALVVGRLRSLSHWLKRIAVEQPVGKGLSDQPAAAQVIQIEHVSNRSCGGEKLVLTDFLPGLRAWRRD